MPRNEKAKQHTERRGREGFSGDARRQSLCSSLRPQHDWAMLVEAAAKRLAHWLPPTPQVHCAELGMMLKLESLQVTGSYKVRGALNAMLCREEAGDRRPVVCASAGNHAQGAAWAAKRVGRRLVVVMPNEAPAVKVERTRSAGAEVVLVSGGYEGAEACARALAERQGYSFLSPFDEPAVIAGQATVGREILALAPRPKVVAVPVGGGGLASGVCLALRESGVAVVGVQVRGMDAMARVLSGKRPLQQLADSLADGVRVLRPGFLTRQLCQEMLAEMVVVEETEVREAMRCLASKARVVAEGAGAVALAGLMKLDTRDGLAVVSGGNIDADLFAAVLREGPKQKFKSRPVTTRSGLTTTQLRGNARC